MKLKPRDPPYLEDLSEEENEKRNNRPMNWQADETAEQYAQRVKRYYDPSFVTERRKSNE